MTMPDLIASGTPDTTGTSSSTPAYGTNIAGDTFVMIVSGRITACTTPTGWSLWGTGNDQAGRRVYIFTRDTRSTGGESGTVTVTLTANSQVSTIHTFRGVALTSFVEDVTNGGSASNGSTLSAPTIDAGGNARLALFVSASGSMVTYVEVTGESGGDWRLRHQVISTTGSNCDQGLYTSVMPVGGTVSGGTASITGIDEHSIVGLALVGDTTDGTPYPVAAGAGVSGTGTLAVPQVASAAGTRAYMQVFVRTGSGQAPNTPSGWSLVAGPHAGTSGTCQQWVFRENTARTGSESGTLSVTFAAGASQKTARMYALENDSGAAVEDVDVALSTDSPVAMPAVTAASTFRRALAFVGIDDDNSIAEATGATGGTWHEAFDEYFGGVNTCIQLQTAGLNAGGTITGGSSVMSGTDDAIVSSFAIVGVENTIEALFTLSIEALGSVSAAKTLNLEALASPTFVRQAQIESLVQGSAVRSPNVEALQGLAATRAAPIESLGEVVSAKTANLETLAVGSSVDTFNLESLVSGQSLHVEQIESLQGVTAVKPANLESLASFTVTKSAQIEALRGSLFAHPINLESLGASSVPVVVQLEGLVAVAAAIELNLEAVDAPSTITAVFELNIESMAVVTVTKGLNLEALAPVSVERTFQLEGLSSGQAERTVQIESLAGVVVPVAVRLEANQLTGSLHVLPIESLQRVNALSVLNIEGSAVTLGFALITVNVESLAARLAVKQMNLESVKLFFIVEPDQCAALAGRDRVGSLLGVDRVGLLRSQ